MNKIDPICGMKGTISAHGHYFCSKGCIEKYEKKHNIKHEECHSCTVKPKKWYKERLFMVGIVVIVLLIIGYFIPYLNDFFEVRSIYQDTEKEP